MGSMEKQVAIVTGGLGGIGKAVGKLLLERGAVVCLVDARPAASGELEQAFGAAKSRAEAHQCDITDNAALEKLFADVFKRHGSIDIVINNAGVTERPLDGTLAWKLVVDVNLTAVINGTRLGLLYMQEKSKRGGNIINVASMGGLLPMPFSPVYSASKHGVVGFTVSVGKELEFAQVPGAPVVRVNCMCPSFTDTAMAREGIDTSPVMKMLVESQGGLLDASLIGKGMLQLLDDKTKHGAIMRVTQRNGIDYKLERPPPKPLSPKKSKL